METNEKKTVRESKIRRIKHDLLNMLREEKYLNVSVGVEKCWGATRKELNTVLNWMKDRGYCVKRIRTTKAPILVGIFLSKEPLDRLELIPLRRDLLIMQMSLKL